MGTDTTKWGEIVGRGRLHETDTTQKIHLTHTSTAQSICAVLHAVLTIETGTCHRHTFGAPHRPHFLNNSSLYLLLHEWYGMWLGGCLCQISLSELYGEED
jgi:hypothetical protein